MKIIILHIYIHMYMDFRCTYKNKNDILLYIYYIYIYAQVEWFAVPCKRTVGLSIAAMPVSVSKKFAGVVCTVPF